MNAHIGAEGRVAVARGIFARPRCGEMGRIGTTQTPATKVVVVRKIERSLESSEFRGC